MNKAIIMGRLTREPEIKTTQGGVEVSRFTLAVNRGKDKDGNDRGADFISCLAFGKSAEAINRSCRQGHRLLVEGHIQTGAYEKDGVKVYTTDVIVDRFEFVELKGETKPAAKEEQQAMPGVPSGFGELDDEDIPF